MLAFGPNSVVGLLKQTTDTTTDTLKVSGDFHEVTLSTSEATSTPVTAFQIHEHPTTNGEEHSTRIYGISNASLASDATLAMRVSPSLDEVEIISTSAVSRTFDLGLGYVGADSVDTLRLNELTIGPNERRVYTPVNWQDLSDSAVIVTIDRDNDGSIDDVKPEGDPVLSAGDVFPVAVNITNVPESAGTIFPLLRTRPEDAVLPDHYGWVSLDTPLAPGRRPTPAMRRSRATLRNWLRIGGGPLLEDGMGLVGIVGKNGPIFDALGKGANSAAPLYHLNSVMKVPLYDQVTPAGQGRPAYFRIAGFALVRVIESTAAYGRNSGCYTDDRYAGSVCGRRIMAELIYKQPFNE
jgi:hypothetical protein